MEFTKDELTAILLALSFLEDEVFLNPNLLDALNSARDKIANLK